MLDLISMRPQIADRRKKLKLIQAALAQKAGITRATVDSRPSWRARKHVRLSARHARCTCRIRNNARPAGIEVRFYIKRHPDFAEIGKSLLREWDNGSLSSLRT